MKFWKISSCVLLVAALLLQSCKKEETTTKSYLDGSLSVTFPTYVTEGFEKTFDIDTMMTVSRGDGGPLGYYFKDSATGESDTLVTSDGTVVTHLYTLTVPDTLANLTLTFGAFAASDYYSSSTSKTYTVVKAGLEGDGSITNFSINAEDRRFVDDRDGKSYYYTNVDGTDWMRQNLAWAGAGGSYAGCEAMDDVFGRFYTWEDAVNACPEGWRLPTDGDWVALGKKFGSSAPERADIYGLAGDLMEDLYFNGTRMWEFWRNVQVTNAGRLSVMPVGYATVEDGVYDFGSVYDYAAFWTGDATDDEAAYRYIFEDQDIVYYGLSSKTDLALSVRCVR